MGLRRKRSSPREIPRAAIEHRRFNMGNGATSKRLNRTRARGTTTTGRVDRPRGARRQRTPAMLLPRQERERRLPDRPQGSRSPDSIQRSGQEHREAKIRDRDVHGRNATTWCGRISKFAQSPRRGEYMLVYPPRKKASRFEKIVLVHLDRFRECAHDATDTRSSTTRSAPFTCKRHQCRHRRSERWCTSGKSRPPGRPSRNTPYRHVNPRNHHQPSRDRSSARRTGE